MAGMIISTEPAMTMGDVSGYEKVYTYDSYGGVRTGVADLEGLPYYFECESGWDEKGPVEDGVYYLSPVSSDRFALIIKHGQFLEGGNEASRQGEVTAGTQPSPEMNYAEAGRIKHMFKYELVIDPANHLRAKAAFKFVEDQTVQPGRKRLWVKWTVVDEEPVTLKITDEQQQNSLQIELPETEYSEWDVRIRFDLQINHTGGSINHSGERVCLDRHQIGIFIRELEELDEKRQGEVSITAMSPDEMYLGIKAIDDLGHLAVVLRTWQRPINYQVYQYKLEAEFAIDPTSLPKIIRFFKKM